MQRGFHLLNPAYKLPDRKALAGPLLNKVYSQLKDKVELAIQVINLLNIVTDESIDINNTLYPYRQYFHSHLLWHLPLAV